MVPVFLPSNCNGGAKPSDPVANVVLYVLVFFLWIFSFVFVCLKDPFLDLISEGGVKCGTFSSV